MVQPAPKGKSFSDLPDEDVDDSTPRSSLASDRGSGGKRSGNRTVNEQVSGGTRVQVVEATPSDEPVAPSPGSDRTPGEPTDSPGGSSDVVTISVTPEEAESMKLLLSQLSMSGGAAGIASMIEQSRAAIARDAQTADADEAALQSHKDRLKEMGVTLQSAATPEIAAREMRARDKLEARTLNMDRATVPGGVYQQPDGTYVNANGDPIEKPSGKAATGDKSKTPETTAA